MSRDECDSFNGRRRDICRGETELPRATENKYRVLWGLPPLPDDKLSAWRLPAKTLVAGITTAPRPRETSYLGRCVDSLLTAGATDVRIFAEPNSDLSNVANHPSPLTIVQRAERFGAWRNWRAMCRQLLAESAAPLVMTIQDDTVFAPDALQYLAEHWCELRDVGFVSLYTPAHYQRKWLVKRRGRTLRHVTSEAEARNRAEKLKGGTWEKYEYPLGINRIRTRSLWGACALIFPREVLAEAIDLRVSEQWKGVTSTHRREREPWEVANVDTVIGHAMNAMKRCMYFINPALAQHIAHVSSIGHGGLGGRRQALKVCDSLSGAIV